jgi:formylmethanofuran dehydrogenase subunit B
MGRAWIGGKPAALERALAEAAGLLAASRCPLIAGLATDIAGARAAIGLAERVGGVIDHMDSEVLLRDVAVLREAGMMMTTPNEARLRADTLLLVGPSLEKEAPDLSRWLGLGPSGKGGAATRRSLVRLCAGGSGTVPGEKTIGRNADHLPVVLAALRARLAGRPLGKAGISAKAIEEVATLLKAARFGVAVWSAVDLDALAIEMLCGIIADLNMETRFTGFAIPPGNNAIGVLQACGWKTGFPMRTGFGRGQPEHDAWRHDGARMIAAGEADCVVWISAYGAAAPRWPDGLPVIALTTGEATLGQTLGRGPAVQIEVAQPGVDHDTVEHCPALGTLVAVAATRRSEATSVADAIGGIVAAIPGTRVAR